MLEDEAGLEIIATIVCDRKSQKGIILKTRDDDQKDSPECSTRDETFFTSD